MQVLSKFENMYINLTINIYLYIIYSLVIYNIKRKSAQQCGALV